MKRKKSVLLMGAFAVLLFLFISIPRYKIVEKISADWIDRSFSFGLQEGIYSGDIRLYLDTNIPFAEKKGFEIYYTMDGSCPTTTSGKYEKPLILSGEGFRVVPMQAVVYQNGEKVGGPYSSTYILTDAKESLNDMLIVSITAKEEDLFSEEKGILYPAESFVSTGVGERWNYFHAQNFAQEGDEWERTAHITIFEGTGAKVIDQNCGLSISGKHGSLLHYPFSLKCKADFAYEAEKNVFAYDFFDEDDGNSAKKHYYDSISFKNSGNDYYWGELREDIKGTMLRNTVGLRMAEEVGLLASRQRLALVFLNGEFYNLTFLTANPNRKAVEVKTGLDDDLIIMNKSEEKECFSYFEIKKLYHSFPDLAASDIFKRREAFERKVDVEALLRYYAFECLIGNDDWPHNNYALWRYEGNEIEGNPYSDGKLRHWVFDLDCMYDLQEWSNDPWDALFSGIDDRNCLLAILLQVDDYKNIFVNMVLELLNSETFAEEHILAVIDEENAKYAPWFLWLYGEDAEREREENVEQLKKNVLARRSQVAYSLKKYLDVDVGATGQIRSE